MRKTFWLLPLLLLGASAACSQSIENENSAVGQLVREMLNLPAPPPPAGLPGSDLPQNNPMRAPQFTEPAEDAPLKTLGRYWIKIGKPREKAPSAKVMQRLLDFCESEPGYLADLIDLLPRDVAASKRVKAIFDRQTSLQGEEWNQKVVAYLQANGGYFHEQLLAEARKAHDDEEIGGVEHSEQVERLAEVDWPMAVPLLADLGKGNDKRTALLAKTLIYLHYAKLGSEAQAAGLRVELKNVVEDRKALGFCRDKAADALLETSWSGRDEWYLSLFHDATLRRMKDGYWVRTPLTGPVSKDPDHWIPIMARLVDDPDRAVHDAAVSCLVMFQLHGARKDALLPLLPWLFDPKWSSAEDRLRLIQSTDELNMKEAVPGLIAVLGNSEDYDRSYAADSLAYFRDPRAVPALRRALAKEKEGDHRRRIIKGLIACKGLSPEEEAKDVEAYLAFVSTPAGSKAWESSMWAGSKASIPAEVAVGGYISQQGPEDEQAVRLLDARAIEIGRTDRDGADRLRKLIAGWHSSTADRAVVRDLRDGKVTAIALAEALGRRESMQKTAGEDLHQLESGTGFPAGAAAVLLADSGREKEILSSALDYAAMKAILVCARLVREKMDPVLVGKLLNAQDPLLLDSAEAYLESEDSAAARELVLTRHKGDAKILGARSEFDPGHHTFPEFDRFESQLQSELKEAKDSMEVYALLSAGYWGSAGQIMVRVKGEQAELMYIHDSARYSVRILNPQEWSGLKKWLDENQTDQIGPLNLAAFDGMQYEYVHLGRDGGRRVFMNNPGLGGSGGSAYDLLCDKFRELLSAAPMKLHYRMEESVPGFEVLLADSRFSVENVWKHGDDLRVAIATEREYRKLKASSVGALAIADGDLGPDQALSWIRIEGGHRKSVTAPAAFPLDDPLGVIPAELEKEQRESGVRDALWPLTVGQKSYRVGGWGAQKDGVWEFQPAHEPRIVLEEQFMHPVLSPDGRWMVASACRESWANPNFAVRIDLMTGKFERLSIDDADRVAPLAWIDERGRILIERYREPGRDNPLGPDVPEYWLVDPANGSTEKVTGEFAPLGEYAERPLQPAAGRGFWTAIFNQAENATAIGTYDTADFKFHPVEKIPGLRFNSREMWVDEESYKIYIAYMGHLLRVDLVH